MTLEPIRATTRHQFPPIFFSSSDVKTLPIIRHLIWASNYLAKFYHVWKAGYWEIQITESSGFEKFKVIGNKGKPV